MPKTTSYCRAIVIALHFAVFSSAQTASILPRVFISQVAQHPALDETTRGILDGLKAAGFEPDQTVIVRVECAQGNVLLASQIASKFVAQKPDVIIGVGTLSAQSFVKTARSGQTTLVFSSVTDPLAAGLVKSLDKTGYRISGVSNFVPLEPQLTLFKKLQPNLKTLGVLYNSGESNALRIVQELRAICPRFGFTLMENTATKTGDVPQAAAKLAPQVDALFVSNDNTFLAAFPSVVQAAHRHHIPVYVSDTDAVKEGGLAALGPNQYKVGFQTGTMAARILQDKNTPTMPPVEFPKETELVLNSTVAQQLDLNIPPDVLSQASFTYGSQP